MQLARKVSSAEASLPPVERRRPLTVIAAVAERCTAAFRVLRLYWQREQMRRDLARLTARDIADLRLSPGIVKAEMRRLPWQRISIRDPRR